LQGLVAARQEVDRDVSTISGLREEIDQKNAQMDAIRARLERRERNAMCKCFVYGIVIFLSGLVAGIVVEG
jgi:hypothetical protein